MRAVCPVSSPRPALGFAFLFSVGPLDRLVFSGLALRLDTSIGWSRAGAAQSANRPAKGGSYDTSARLCVVAHDRPIRLERVGLGLLRFLRRKSRQQTFQ